MVVNKITMPSLQPNPPRRLYFNKKMSESPETGQNGDMATVMENFQKKGLSTRPVQVTTSSQILQQTNALSSSCSRVAKSSVTTSSSSRVHHQVTTSSSKASHMKSDLSELKSSISEMKSLSEMKHNSDALNRFRSSLENLVDDTDKGSSEPLVTFPDTPDCTGDVPGGLILSPCGEDTMKFEQKRTHMASKTKVVTDSFSAEKATANSAEMKRLQAGDVSYQERNAAAAMRARLEMDGVLAEKNIAKSQEQRSLKTSEMSQQDIHNRSAASVRLQGENFSSEKMSSTTQQQRQTVTASSVFNHEKQFTIMKTGMSTKSMSSELSTDFLTDSKIEELLQLQFDDLEQLNSNTNPIDVEKAIQKYSKCLDYFIKTLAHDPNSQQAPEILNKMNDIIRKAWSVPTHGHELGLSLCNALRTCGGLDLLMSDSMVGLQYHSAQVLEQCLTTENRAHVVDKGLDKVVNVACACCTQSNTVDHSRVGTGILEHLFKHSEQTCCDVIQLGGLDAVLFECRKNDVETLRHCAGALANLSLYGGAENQEKMIKRKVPMWLFPLAFHNDDNIKYYACLAIAVLVANKEIEAAVLKSGTLDLVEPFVTSHNPFDFAKSNLAHAHGQSKNWLQRLVPVLSSEREEARNLAAFHFCMEAGIKKQQNNTEIFSEIGAIEPLKKVASCPNAVASKYAAQALRLIGEEVPHKLSQQVPLWSTDDVREWVKQIGFADIAANFVESRVDGDLLLQINEANLRQDIGLINGIQRQRFTRELQNLKKMADYSSRDVGNLNGFLQSIGPEFSIYTYSMLNAGVDKDSIRKLSEDQLITECGITNSIHRLRILETIRSTENSATFSYFNEESRDKSLDVFVSYRRSNGSQLASLLKVHLQLRGFSVFIDVERLEAGKFDNNLLQSIRQAKHFLLVLTPKALDRCVGDSECKDWVHREIVAALQSQCNIIPIIDNFQWPEPEELPEDMRAVCHFNGVRWIHDYQDACVDKLERFLRGELNMRPDGNLIRLKASGDGTPGTPASISRHPPNYQRMHSSDSGKSSDNKDGGRD